MSTTNGQNAVSVNIYVSLPPAVQALAHALWGDDGGTPVPCQEIMGLLADYAENRAYGDPMSFEDTKVERHLNNCPACREVYTMLVDIEVAEASGTFEVK